MREASLLHWLAFYFVPYLYSVPEIDTMGETDIVCASRYQSVIYSMMTEIALLGDSPFMIKGDGLIGTGLYTFLTSRTSVIIHDHNAVFPF